MPGDASDALSLAEFRLGQARQLEASVKASCVIVQVLITLISVPFLANGDYAMALIWFLSSSTMVLVTYFYSTSREVTAHNFEGYLKGHVWVSCATGLVWSAITIYQLDPDSVLSIYLGITIPCSITLGGMFPSSAYRATYIGLLTCCVLPVAVYWLLVMEGPYRFLCLGMFMFYGFGLFSSAKTELNMRDLLLAKQSQVLNEKLKSENEIIEQVSQERAKFVAATVHDFSQPLHAQGYFIHALKSELSRQKELDLLERIESSWKMQSQLVQGIAEILRFDSGFVKPKPMHLKVEDILQKISDEFRAESEEKRIELRVTIEKASIFTDPVLFARILRNLLSNAFRYTPAEGRISLSSHCDSGQVIITVADTGIGINPAHHAKVFDEYEQLLDESLEDSGGSGLGLSIVSRLSKLLELDLQMDSTKGKGTTFELRLPEVSNTVADTPQKSPELILDTKPLVIIVDDDTDILDSMTITLETWGCDIIASTNSVDAIAKLTNRNQTPDLLIVDYHLLSDEDGLEVIDRLRDEVNSHVPAIIMTGNTQGISSPDSNSQVTLLTKPVDPNELRRALENQVTKHESRRSS